MWLRKMKTAAPRPGLLVNLNDDVLRLVLEQVLEIQGLSGLGRMSLVCQYLYRLAVPCLYRSMTIDMSRASNLHLLKRLAEPQSRLPGLIRDLCISRVSEIHGPLMEDLATVVAGLKHLVTLSWSESSLGVPLSILELVYEKFPQAQLAMAADCCALAAPADDEYYYSPPYMCSILKHPISSRLTYFTFVPLTSDELYPELKSDLFKMLSQNRQLREFRISVHSARQEDFPDMVESFRTCQLPQLEALVLYTQPRFQFFTPRELAIWASSQGGGWKKLHTLALSSASDLMHFLGRAPLLSELTVIPVGQADYEELEKYMDKHPIADPLPSLSRLWFSGPPTMAGSPVAQDRCLIPWCLLRCRPSLESLGLSRPKFTRGSPGPGLEVPTAPEIQTIRHLCPHLARLSLDITLQGAYAEWPVDILTELAQFQKPIELSFFLHRRDCRRARAMVNALELLAVMRHLRSVRKRLALPVHGPFGMNWKLIRPCHEMQGHWDAPDYTAWIHGEGFVDTLLYQKYNYGYMDEQMPDQMSYEELRWRGKRWCCKLRGSGRNLYAQEMKRRHGYNSRIARFSCNATLYDSLADA
ncbi:hypothetical protein ACEQ8H_001068 [Pleosporales sp. CAS-2024a]